MIDPQNRSALMEWIPYRLVQQEGQSLCRWLYIGKKRFTEPFFDSTIAVCQQEPQNSRMLRSMSSADALLQWKNYCEPVPPAALIFHVSRCGSTLISQLLASSDENIVLSEVPFFDELLMGRAGVNLDAPDKNLLSAAIAFHSHRRHTEQKRFFIKTDSWHMFYYREWRELFPSLPLVLLYREPAAVIRSHKKQPGMHAVPGLSPSGLFDFGEAGETWSPEHYMGKVLEKYYRCFLDIARQDVNAVLINYGNGVMEMMEKISSAAGLNPDETQRAQWLDRSKYHAKHPDKSFGGDGNKEIDLHAFPEAIKAYEELENYRLEKTF